MELGTRERFVRLFRGEPVDRAPFMQFMAPWDSAIERWKTEGLDESVSREELLHLMGFEGDLGYKLPTKSLVWPEFEPQILEDHGEYLVVRNKWGGIARTHTDFRFHEITLSGPVADRASWEVIRQRLQADTAGRLPAEWGAVCRQARESGEPVWTGALPTGFFGGARELLGFERLVSLFYDDPDLVYEILDTLCDLWIALYTRVQGDVAIDYFFIWEDMCYKGGPLISPSLFGQFLLPRYVRLTSALKQAGVKLILVDSDGDFRQLIPLWIEGGVDITFPWETQFGLDITESRRQYPRLGMIGGIDKQAFVEGRAGVDRALEKIPYMLESGRYIPAVDHGVTHDVSWDTYRYFCNRLRELVCKYPPNPG